MLSVLVFAFWFFSLDLRQDNPRDSGDIARISDTTMMLSFEWNFQHRECAFHSTGLDTAQIGEGCFEIEMLPEGFWEWNPVSAKARPELPEIIGSPETLSEGRIANPVQKSAEGHLWAGRDSNPYLCRAKAAFSRLNHPSF